MFKPQGMNSIQSLFECGVNMAIAFFRMRFSSSSWALRFWMEQASYLIVSALALLFVIAFRKYVIRLNNTFFIFDAIGLGLFVVVGIAKTLDFGFPMWVDVVFSILL